ncbi:hypothetical protein OFY17_07685 [Marinomonas sp. C2222]|uniref:Chromosome partition protein Smc n=1 Tax=Marinomonas sargassi TaxID=2984494 RepID=A0ABT2YSA1_9GAMM|nr:hypothetical protein [Marinomonas sargassi]MCV2402763.1 hypothetical protein [Marinomonas sargassi]
MRKDDDVEIPSLTLDQDEVSERRPNKAAPQPRATPSPSRPAHAPPVAHKKTSLAGIYILLLLILGASGGAGYWLWDQNQQLRNELYGAKSEIQNLDHQLLAADVSANKQGQTIEETLKIHDSEIRKLWGVAYDRNRKAIAENNEVLESINKKLATLSDNVSTQGKRIAIQAEAFNEVEANYNKILPTVSAIDQKVQGTEIVLGEQAKTLASMDEKLTAQTGLVEVQSIDAARLQSALDNIKGELTALESKLASVESNVAKEETAVLPAEMANIQQTLSNHEDAIQSNDTFRTQVNAEIIRLRKQINQFILEQQLNAE